MELSFDQIREQIHGLLNPDRDDMEKHYWVRDLYADRCVYVGDQGKLYQQGYSVTDGVVSLAGNPVEVVVTYDPVPAANADGTPPEMPEQPDVTSLAALAKAKIFTAPEPDDSQPESGESDDAQETPEDTQEAAPEDEEKPEPETLSSPAKDERRILITLSSDAVQKNNQAWINIINLGEYVHDQYGDIEFTVEKFESWQKNLKAGVLGGLLPDGTYGVAIDYSHSMDEDVAPEEQKAAGVIKDLKLEKDGDIDRVFALIEFNQKAADGIRSGEWLWFSISELSGFTNQKTGENTGPILRGGALTNRPFIPGLLAAELPSIQLSDLRPSKAMLLSKQLAKERADRQAAETKLFNQTVAASLSALEQAGVPPVVMKLARPLIEADRNAAAMTFRFSGAEHSLKPGEIVAKALLEFAKVGGVPLGERTKRPDDPMLLSMNDAKGIIRKEWEKEGKQNARETDVILAARKRWPHLKEPKTEE